VGALFTSSFKFMRPYAQARVFPRSFPRYASPSQASPKFKILRKKFFQGFLFIRRRKRRKNPKSL